MSMNLFESIFGDGLTEGEVRGIIAEEAENARQRKIDEELRGDFDERLAQIAGMDQQQSMVARHDEPAHTVSVPKGMSLETAEGNIHAQREADENFDSFNYPMPGVNYFDGLVALEASLQAMYGMTGKGRARWSFFGGVQRPEKLDIQVGLKVNPDNPTGPLIPDFREVPTGEFQFGPLEATIRPYSWSDGSMEMLFAFTITCKAKNKHRAMATKVLVEQYLKRHSIYRGHILEFDPKGENGVVLKQVDRQINPTIVYSAEAQRALQNNVWGKIDARDELTRRGKRPDFRVLMYGPLGTGKSEGLVATAVRARNHGMTVVEYRPTSTPSVLELQKVWRLAKMYAPAVVLVEDFDRFFPEGGLAPADRAIITNLLDGVDKSQPVSMLMTTNFLDRIDPSVIRPPRMTGLVEIEHLDRDGIEELLHRTLSGKLADDIDFNRIWAVVEGYSPAFIRTCYDNAEAYAIQAGHEGLITTDALVDAAQASYNHNKVYERLDKAKSEPEVDHLRVGLQQVIIDALGTEEGRTVLGRAAAAVMSFSLTSTKGDRLSPVADRA